MSQTPAPTPQPLPFRGPTPQLAKPIATRNKLLYWSLFGVAIFIMLGCCLLSFAGDLLESGAAAFVGAFAAVLLVPIYVSLFLWLDRFEPEPPHLLVLAFIWGAGIAGLFACIANTVVGMFFNAATGNADLSNQLMASLSAPLMEETLKGLAVLIIFFWRKAEFDGIIDGIIYAGMTALGFAMIENISYYSRGMTAGGVGGLFGTLILRGILSPYAHVLFTSMTGIGFGIARQAKSTPIKFIAPVIGWMLAMSLHFLWNTIPALLGALFGDAGNVLFFVVYLVIWIPLFMSLFAVIIYSLRQESKLIRKYLLLNQSTSLIYAEDAANASRLLPRLLANLPVLFTRGTAAWLSLRHYQHAATSLAFYRYRVDGGRMAPNPELETKYIQQIVANRPSAKAPAATHR